MDVSNYTVQNLALASWTWVRSEQAPHPSEASPSPLQPQQSKLDMLRPLRRWLDTLEVSSPNLAHSLCQLIPSQCPFERDIKVLGRTLLHIPPLCKLNPLYDEVVGLRFRALSYLADECGEDVTPYC